MNLNSFKQHYLSEAVNDTVIINFGRFNPPTNGHEKLLNKSMEAGVGTHRVYASQSQDSKKNPLDYVTKVKWMRKMFPKHARHILLDKNVRNMFDALVVAYKDGFKNCIVVVGSDRVNEFDKALNKYNGVKSRHGLYDFMSLKVVSAGERDPDADDVSGMSASKLRDAAKKSDLQTFTKGMPKGFKDAKGLMNAVRSGMGLKECYSFRKDIKLQRESHLREKYVAGDLFKSGDSVVIVDSLQLGTINNLYSNHVEVILESGKTENFWISDICLNKE